ncbi:MAG: helix-hairpin-helix domain-containing protein [Flavobacteriales bacterium]|nr:helix-hairpin-helix domain-containing protein [Flavobacteriales bacterium]
MNSLKNLLFLGVLFIPSVFWAQELEDEKYNIIEQRVDFLLDVNEGGETDFTTLFEQLEVFYQKPINLNTANKFTIEELGLLNPIQINNLLAHIERNGKLISFEELQSIEGFDLEDLRLIQPFTKVSRDLDQANISLSNILKEGSSSLFIRYTRILEEQEGFSSISKEELDKNKNARYLGSPDKLFTRYRFNYANNISFGFTTEKDAGEEFFQGSNKNEFDFYSMHLFARGFGIVKQLAIGDFQAQFGQGLTFWSGLAFGRSPCVYTLKRNAPKLRPYTSVQEDLFLRGGGISLQHKNIELTLFYSSQKVDANVSGRDTLSNENIISSLSEDGFHRTLSEVKDRNIVQNTFIGGNLSYEKRNFTFGITGVYNNIGAKFQARKTVYNQFGLLDDENMNVGADFSYLYRNLNFFGEASKSIDGGIAHTVGVLIALDPKLSLGVQNRNFERNFKAIQSNAIGESSNNTNEKGTFIGIEIKPNNHFTIAAYADRFAFNWLRFQTDAPSNGHRLLAQINYKPSKRMETYFRFRQRSRGRNSKESTESLNELVEEVNSNFRIHLAYKVSKEIQIKSRVEFTRYHLGAGQNEDGLLIYQDISYKKLSFPVSFSLRYALFETDSYNSRIYAYESDVLYAFSIPAYNGIGTRFYITFKYHIKRGVDLWLRYAQTYYTDRTSIGSGKDEIEGNIRSEVKAQLRIKF